MLLQDAMVYIYIYMYVGKTDCSESGFYTTYKTVMVYV